MFLKRTLLAIASIGLLSIYGFNCAKTNTPLEDLSAFDHNSINEFSEPEQTMYKLADSPVALLSGEQVYRSMLSVAGISAPSNEIIGEYNRRKGSFATGNSVELMNSPMVIGMTSLGGEICNSIINREKPLKIESRKYLGSVDLSKNVAAVTAEQYAEIIYNFSNYFWGRPVTEEEQGILNEFRTSYETALSATDKAAVASSTKLVLSTCAALISTFDAMTY
jgi:hypothetical protein